MFSVPEQTQLPVRSVYLVILLSKHNLSVLVIIRARVVYNEVIRHSELEMRLIVIAAILALVDS